MGLLDPRAPEALERLDRVCGVVLHALEDHDAGPATAQDLRLEDLELVLHTHLADLRLDQALGGIPERALDLADTDKAQIRVADHLLNGERREEV